VGDRRNTPWATHAVDLEAMPTVEAMPKRSWAAEGIENSRLHGTGVARRRWEHEWEHASVSPLICQRGQWAS
jgi:hypothetical protein